MTPCTCRTCRDFDFTRWGWKYVPVRYGRQSLKGLLRWLDRGKVAR